MRIGILSDIHSNLEALESVLEFAKTQDIDQYVCIGDIVGYGADPNKCIDIVKGLTSKIVAGNHDFGVCDLTDISYFNDVARKAIEWTRKVIKKEHMDFLRTLPLVMESGNAFFVHATPSSPDRWNYILTVYDAMKEFGFFENHFCFVGHSHQPDVFLIKPDKQVSIFMNDLLVSNKQERYIVNAGSVGQPRDNNPKACFLVYDADEQSIAFSRIEYDIKKTQTKILNACLPPFLAQRLEIGR